MTTLIVFSLLFGLPLAICSTQRMIDGKWPRWSLVIRIRLRKVYRRKIKPFVATKLWPKAQALGKWLWDHKSHKSVWLTATLTFLGALVALCYWMVRRAWRNPGWISNLPWFWIMAVLTPFVVLIEALLVILIWQGVITKSKLAKIHLWVIGVLGGMGCIVYMFFAPWARIWDWISAHASGVWDMVKANPIPWLVGLAVVLVIILWIVRIVRKKGHHAPAATSSGGHGAHGGHGHGGHGGGIPWGWIILTIMVLGGISIYFQSKEIVENRRRSQWAASDSNGRQALVTHGFVTALPDREVPIYIPEGMYVTTDPAYTNQNVWVRYDGEDRFMDRKGRTNAGIVTHNNLRSRHLFLQSAEATPVVVEWSLRPLPNR